MGKVKLLQSQISRLLLNNSFTVLLKRHLYQVTSRSLLWYRIYFHNFLLMG